MLLTLLLCLISALGGVVYGSANPNIVAEAQADLHKAAAAEKRVQAAVMAKLHNVNLE